MVRYVRVADGTEEDGIMGVKALKAVLGHHRASFAVEVGAPREVGKVEIEAAAGRGNGVEDFLSFRNDFGAYAVTGDDGYGV